MRPLRRARPGRPADCREVGRMLQAFLDHEVDDLTGGRVARHLGLCRTCGMEAAVYTEIKAALTRRGAPVDPEVVRHLRHFSEQLASSGPDHRDGGEGPGEVPPGA
ncbi:MAG: zf-HC2 domain-containing protein [Acidimicrobiales bacterium]